MAITGASSVSHTHIHAHHPDHGHSDHGHSGGGALLPRTPSASPSPEARAKSKSAGPGTGVSVGTIRRNKQDTAQHSGESRTMLAPHMLGYQQKMNKHTQGSTPHGNRLQSPHSDKRRPISSAI